MSDDNNKQQNERQKRELGALWVREGKSGKYFYGKIGEKDNQEEVVIFRNKNKNGDNHPDFIIYKSENRQTSSTTVKKQEEQTVATDNAEEDLC